MKDLNCLFILVSILVGCAPAENTALTAFPTNTVPISATNTAAPPDEITDSKEVMMRFIPAEEFTMGSDEAKSPDDRDEKPAHLVYLDAFYIDKYEVTNSLYRVCVN